MLNDVDVTKIGTSLNGLIHELMNCFVRRERERERESEEEREEEREREDERMACIWTSSVVRCFVGTRSDRI